LYSDSSLAAAKAFGIAFQLSDETLARYAGFGIDLDEASGQDHHQLPVPSAFLVDGSGTIRWSYSNPDYRIRPDNKTLVEAAPKLRPKVSPKTSPQPPPEKSD